MREVSIIGVVALFLLSCAASETTMTTQQLTSAISGNTIYGVNSKGQKFIQIFSYDGTLNSGPADIRDNNGKWKPIEYGN